MKSEKNGTKTDNLEEAKGQGKQPGQYRVQPLGKGLVAGNKGDTEEDSQLFMHYKVMRGHQEDQAGASTEHKL